jgi:acetoacetyl-CoA synthetase
VLRHVDGAHAAGHPAILFADEPMLATGQLHSTSWPQLRAQVAAMASALRRMGVRRGDRVCAYLPNRPETAAVFLACASIGAIWSICSPDMGPVAVLDRFRQIEPTVLIACDGYRYGGVAHDRSAVVAELVEQLPSVAHVVWQSLLGTRAAPMWPERITTHDLAALLSGDAPPFEPEWLPFDHPLWVVYSSGTTGLPKPIVHGHGGVMLEGLKLATLHNNIAPSVLTGERYHWYSSTGWIMWNSQVGGLLGGTTICLFDGSPGGPSKAPDWTTLWRFAALSKATFFGAGAAFYASCLKAGVKPKEAADLSALRALGSTGSPLANECYRWAWDQCPQVDGRDIWLTPMSGGTDFAGAFIAGLPTLPMIEGEMQCRCLGAAVEAWASPMPTVAAQPDRRRGRLVHEANAVDAAVSVGRCRWPAPARQHLRHVPRHLAARRLDSHRAAPESAPAARSSTAAATPPSTATAFAWALRSCTARWRRCPRCSTAWWSISSTSAAKAGCRCSWCCATGTHSMTSWCGASSRPCAPPCRRAMCPTTCSR